MPEASPEQINEIEKEMASIETKIAAAQAKAAGSGGLFQAMALIEEQTQRVTHSMLKQKLLMIKFRMAFPDDSQLPKKSREPIGRMVDDKGAL